MAERSLIGAVKAGDPAAVERALSEGATMDERDEQGWTAPCRAAGACLVPSGAAPGMTVESLSRRVALAQLEAGPLDDLEALLAGLKAARVAGDPGEPA